ncbi:MAG TPA: SRPBCC domain-containing protein [Spirochaetia bacterium]|nr:SRPBCC domain-containing protein [Spirochaetia bacterium]
MKRPIVLAHRGLHSAHRENSLAAFRAAFSADADGIECDLQKTEKGAYVIIHDPPPRRPAKSALPPLPSMLASLPEGAFLNLELKSDTIHPSDCPAILDALRRRPAPGPLLVSSFEPRLLPYFKRRGVPIGLLVGEEAARLGIAGMARQLWRLKPDYLNLPILMFEVLGKRRGLLLVRILRILGFSLAFWTVNRDKEVLLVADKAEILITDSPETVKKALADERMRGKRGHDIIERAMKTDSLKVSAVIPADPEAVYAAWLSNKEHGAMTETPAAQIVARVGGKFKAGGGYMWGATLELDPPGKIVQSWRTTEFPKDAPDSRLEVILEKAKGGTRITIIQTEIPQGQGESYRQGWIDYYFEPMKRYFAGRK